MLSTEEVKTKGKELKKQVSNLSSSKTSTYVSSHNRIKLTTDEIAQDYLSKYKNEASEEVATSFVKVNGMIDNLNIMMDMIVN